MSDDKQPDPMAKYRKPAHTPHGTGPIDYDRVIADMERIKLESEASIRAIQARGAPEEQKTVVQPLAESFAAREADDEGHQLGGFGRHNDGSRTSGR